MMMMAVMVYRHDNEMIEWKIDKFDTCEEEKVKFDDVRERERKAQWKFKWKNKTPQRKKEIRRK